MSWTVFWIIVIICAFIVSMFILAVDEVKKQEVEARFKERMLSNKLPCKVTGYSFFDFEIKITKDLCEESLELLKKLKVGDFLTCMICPFKENSDEVFINIGWFEIGIAEYKARDKLFNRINSGNYVCCQCIQIIGDNDNKRYYARYIYWDELGTFYMVKDLSPYKSSDDSTEKLSINHGELDMKYYTWISPVGQLVDNMRKEYYKGGVPFYGDETEEVIEEDNGFLTMFVKDYLRGIINSAEDKSNFIRECTSSRIFGNSKILRKRINLYIKESGIEFIF